MISSVNGILAITFSLSGENSPGGCKPNARPNSAQTEEADAARRVVGSVHSSGEGRNETGAKGPNLNAGNSVATDEAMAPLLGILTPLKVQAPQRTLYRKAKDTPLVPIAVRRMFSESRMREIRPSGLMRGGECSGELTTTVGSISVRELPAYSTPLGSSPSAPPDSVGS